MHVWISMGPFRSSYTLQVCSYNVWRHRARIGTPSFFRFSRMVALMFLPRNMNHDTHVPPHSPVENLMHVWISMGPFRSSYTLQVCSYNVRRHRATIRTPSFFCISKMAALMFLSRNETHVTHDPPHSPVESLINVWLNMGLS